MVFQCLVFQTILLPFLSTTQHKIFFEMSAIDFCCAIMQMYEMELEVTPLIITHMTVFTGSTTLLPVMFSGNTCLNHRMWRLLRKRNCNMSWRRTRLFKFRFVIWLIFVLILEPFISCSCTPLALRRLTIAFFFFWVSMGLTCGGGRVMPLLSW